MANKVENKGFDYILGKDKYVIKTVKYPKPGDRYYAFTLLREQVATSNLFTINSSITSGSNMIITGNILNHGGDILSGGNMQINGNVENKVTSFVVTGLEKFYERSYKDCNFLGFKCRHYERKTTYESATLYSNTGSKIGAAGSLAITGKKITNHVGHASFNVGMGIGNITVADIIPIVGVPVQTDSILNSGLFTTNTSGQIQTITGSNGNNVNFSYLVESNIQFTSHNAFITSDYFFTQINFSPSTNVVLFGDPTAERELLLNSLAALGAVQFLNGGNAAVDSLYENGAAFFNQNQASMNLTFGTALTPAQIASLTTDIVLPVFQEINGVQVLVPQVFLSPATIVFSSNTGAGGQIFAGGDMILTSNTDILNSGNLVWRKYDDYGYKQLYKYWRADNCRSQL